MKMMIIMMMKIMLVNWSTTMRSGEAVNDRNSNNSFTLKKQNKTKQNTHIKNSNFKTLTTIITKLSPLKKILQEKKKNKILTQLKVSFVTN